MDIMLEAHEFHSIEQYERKGKYEKKYHAEMEKKVNDWNEISMKYKGRQAISSDDIHFMLQEISLFFTSTTPEMPYLKGFQIHVEKQHRLTKSIETFYEVLYVYFEFAQFFSFQTLPFFNRKKALLDIFNEAKKAESITREKAQKLKSYIQKEYYFQEEWEEIKDKSKSLQSKVMQMEELSLAELEWLIGVSRFSLLEQLDFGDLYFAHHFQRVSKNEYYDNRLEDCKKLFLAFEEPIRKFSKMTEKSIGLFQKKWFFEEMVEMMKNAKFAHYSEYRRVQQRVSQAMKDNEE